MSTGWVFLCPGQGSQSVGMGKALYDASARARDLIDSANDVLGVDLKSIAFEGPEEELKKTVNTQPAMFVMDVVVATLLREKGVTPVMTAGHSLGEYAACVVAGTLSYEEGLTLTRLRGDLMYRAGLERPGAMAAVLGLEASAVEAVLDTISGIVVPANLNTPKQIVISGEVDAVEAALPKLKEAGAKRALLLPVSGAFHSPLMEPAAAGLTEALRAASFATAEVPVVANVSARPLTRGDEIRDALVAQLTGQVRWSESMAGLLEAGHGRFVETGPGKALSGMLKQIDRAAEVRNVDDPEAVTAFAAEALGS